MEGETEERGRERGVGGGSSGTPHLQGHLLRHGLTDVLEAEGDGAALRGLTHDEGVAAQQEVQVPEAPVQRAAEVRLWVRRGHGGGDGVRDDGGHCQGLVLRGGRAGGGGQAMICRGIAPCPQRSPAESSLNPPPSSGLRLVGGGGGG